MLTQLPACSAEDMRRYGISTILDLRRMDRPCKKKGKKIDKLRTAVRFARKVRQRPLQLGQTFALLRAHATRYLLPLSQSC